jgi:hypothetical protein
MLERVHLTSGTPGVDADRRDETSDDIRVHSAECHTALAVVDIAKAYRPEGSHHQ